MKHPDQSLLALLSKYDIPLPRYTSYPTVPFWEADTLDIPTWEQSVQATFDSDNREVSIYVHLPYCESLCTFCACNKRITRNHLVEDPYIDAVLKEWNYYSNILPSQAIIKEIHLGGGTPTFFSPENLKRLIDGLVADHIVPDDREFSVEVHPNYTTSEHLQVLFDCGFRRISAGVQDFDPVVQHIINRNQSFETTLRTVEDARRIGFDSVNIDIIYGLPKQTLKSVDFTMERMALLRPDRIAYYSYAHVPWKSKVQRRYTEADIPPAVEKWEMYQAGKNALTSMGFQSIGMDHFALEDDGLMDAWSKGNMHRNFMGYTTTVNKMLIGLGASSISDSWTAFRQNEKDVDTYVRDVAANTFPISNGHKLNSEDLSIRQHILDIMCRDRTTIDLSSFDKAFAVSVNEKMIQLQDDEFLVWNGSTIEVTELGRSFVRVIAAAIDARLWRSRPEGSLFSRAI